MQPRSLAHVCDGTLRSRLAALVDTDRITTAELLLHLAEFESRRLHAKDGYPSLFAYCVRELCFSEDIAYKRIRVARAARRVPQLLDSIADGRLHLAGAVLLTPHLDRENAAGLLAAAEHKTKAEIELLVAQRFPQKDAPTLVRAIPSAAPPSVAPTGQVAPGPVGPTGLPAESLRESPDAPLLPTWERSGELVLESVDPSSNHAGAATVATPEPASEVALEPPPVRTTSARVMPLSSGRYLFKTTIGQSAHDKLRRLQNLLGLQVPSGDVAQVLERAFDALLEKLEKAKHAATDRPRGRSPRPSADPRHIPAEVKRQVWGRDGGRCTYVGQSGERCAADKFLEFDHVLEVARGGTATVDNLRLLCRTHNQHMAERSFGVDFMRAKRLAPRSRAEEGRAGVCTHPG
jgi:5-methylcytosine-specific restriction endonuclease McrA